MESTTPIPQAFLERMQSLLGDEFPTFLACLAQPATTGLRVNTLKISPEGFRAISPFPLSSIPWSPAGFLIDPASQSDTSSPPGKHPYHAAGLYYLQDPSAMIAAQILAPQPGERVLDIAAAPGGKATHLAALMQGEGLLVANEIHTQRAWDLAQNLERCGVRNAAITNEPPGRLAEHFGAFFDRVLVDAPCSGEGMFRKSEAARAAWAPELIQGCATRQNAILKNAARMVRTGGWLAYTTCTFAPEENEAVVARFLDENPDFELVSPSLPSLEPPNETGTHEKSLPQHIPGISSGCPEWTTYPDHPVQHTSRVQQTVRLWPHRTFGEGHFIALLRRAKGAAVSPPRTWVPSTVPKHLRQVFTDFRRSNLSPDHMGERLLLSGAYLYQLPSHLPDLSNLRVIHPGWWLGVFKNERFLPTHALAMGLQAKDVLRVVNLDSTGSQVLAYLRGESLPSQGEDGWVMVTVDGYPLGWGKRVGRTLKNHYPRGLRWF